MRDPATFESRFADAVGRYADLAPGDVEPVSMTLTVTARASRPALRWASSFGSSRMAMLVLLMLLALAAIGAAVVGAELLRKPVPVNHGIFAPTGVMTETRIDATATRLPDGRVLIAGGWNQLRTGLAVSRNDDGSPALATAEIFDPATETFRTVGSMIQARRDATATLLTDGRVLIAGGFPSAPTTDGSENPGDALDTAEVFDSATNTFSSVGAMTSTRGFHSATLLQDGTVLLAGGLGYQGGESPEGPGTAPLDSVETYDPATQTFRSIGSRMHTGRHRPTATRLLDGRVLIVGDGGSLPLADIFDPRSERFTGVPATDAGASASSASTLPNGLVLLIGEGLRPDGTRTLTPSWQQFDPTTDTFTAITPGGGFGDLIVPLADGRLLILGAPPPGVGLPVEATSQVFDPQTGAVKNVGPMIDLREDGQTATLLSDGRVLVVGGRLGNSQDVGSATNPPYTYVAYQSAELFEP
jgi:hypothetical protein